MVVTEADNIWRAGVNGAFFIPYLWGPSLSNSSQGVAFATRVDYIDTTGNLVGLIAPTAKLPPWNL